MLKRGTVVIADYSFTDDLHILSTSVGGRIYFIFTVLPCGPCKSRCTSSAFMPVVFSVSTFVMKSPFLSIPDECALPAPGVRACQKERYQSAQSWGQHERKKYYPKDFVLLLDYVCPRLDPPTSLLFASMVNVLCHAQWKGGTR